MKKNQGFTLIELLAVIIILAVIALIATPIVLNVVDKAKENARQSSIAGFADATKLAIVDSQFANNGTIPTINEEFINSITYHGDKVVCGQDGQKPGIYYSSTYGVVLHGCKVELKSTKKTRSAAVEYYYFASGKVYKDANNPTYKAIFESLKGGSGEIILKGTKIGEKVLTQYPNLALANTEAKGCADNLNNYSYMGGCYLKYSVESNYIWFSGFLYRIMGINADGSIRMITEENVTVLSYLKASTDFTGSHAEKWLNEFYDSNMKKTDKVVESKFCQGAAIDTSTPMRKNCVGGTEIIKKIGSISIDEYNLGGGSKSYLNTNSLFWTISPYGGQFVWRISNDGSVNAFPGTNIIGLRPIINIDPDTIITDGDGTVNNNFILNQDKTVDVTGKLNDKSISGEYVKLSNKVYRIVGKNSDGTTKLILDSYYQEIFGKNFRIAYGTNNVFTKDIGVGYKLNTDILNFLASDDTTKGKIKMDTKWYQNKFINGYDYTEASKENSTPIIVPVGLINIGELLSGQSASIVLKTDYWILTPPLNPESIFRISQNGSIYGGLATSTSAIRPVINVNANVMITSGNGTVIKPYEI